MVHTLLPNYNKRRECHALSIREFLLLIGVKHCLTLAYSKEENAIVGRYNKEINQHLRALTYDAGAVQTSKRYYKVAIGL